LGKLDNSEIYAWLGEMTGQRVLDIGCGFGDALRYLKDFESYHGFDLDQRAISHLKLRRPEPNIHVYAEKLSLRRLHEIRPTVCVAIGLLHHISNRDAQELLSLLGQAPLLRRVITLDTVYVQGATLNNLIASLDRGKFVRTPEQFVGLIKESAQFTVTKHDLSLERAGRGMAYYFSMCLEPKGKPS
jgi:SAM-dependent methyltransferase